MESISGRRSTPVEGTGERILTWKTEIPEPGYYEIYCYVGKNIERMRVRGPGGPGGPGGPEGPGVPRDDQNREDRYKDMHYSVYHDEGIEEITIDYENTEGGWNSLGRYYLSPDTAKVILSNKSSGKLVIGDAIKWVKQN